MTCPTCGWSGATAIGCGSCGWKGGTEPTAPNPDLHPAALADLHPINKLVATPAVLQWPNVPPVTK